LTPSIILRGNQDAVTAVAINKLWIAAAGAGTAVRLWSRDINALRALARSTAGRDFSQDERIEFLENRN